MDQPEVNINKPGYKKRVLVAPLEWGLGHATRCVPVIRELLLQNFEVILGAEGSVANLLREEFPALDTIPLGRYKIKYGKGRAGLFLKMLLQLPKLLLAIKKEHHQLEKLIISHRIDIIISDNRYGLHSNQAHCIFITHQLLIKTGNRLTDRLLQQENYRRITRFDECWVPDLPGSVNLAGDLSHPDKPPPVSVSYIGSLSRFQKIDAPKNIDVLAVVSGPEPQRTIFEQLLLAQLKKLPGKKMFVRGLPGTAARAAQEHAELIIKNHLAAADLNDAMLRAKLIIARSGYSTVMDLAAIAGRALLIPTPGQTEQEYLAAFLAEKKYCVVASQKNLDLAGILDTLSNDVFVPFPENDINLLRAAIKTLR